MKLTRRVSVWNLFVRYGRSAVGVTLLLAGMSAVSQAHNHGSWYLPSGHYTQPTPSPITNPSPPPERLDESGVVCSRNRRRRRGRRPGAPHRNGDAAAGSSAGAMNGTHS